MEGELSADDWPHGCCGYAVNLLRPARPGFRAQVLYPVIGTTLARASNARAHIVECLGEHVRCRVPGQRPVISRALSVQLLCSWARPVSGPPSFLFPPLLRSALLNLLLTQGGLQWTCMRHCACIATSFEGQLTNAGLNKASAVSFW